MTTDYSISVDDWNYEDWTFIGRELEDEKHGDWSEDNPKGLDCDSFIPIMLYAYPLYDRPSDQAIFKIHDKTNLTVVMKNDTEEYYLALCGGGMDLSQDIGMAYIIAQNNIPFALATQISTQPNLSQYGANFRKVMKYCKKSIKSEIRNAKYSLDKINQARKESLEMDKRKLNHVSELRG